jgi:transposase InsO family protein
MVAANESLPASRLVGTRPRPARPQSVSQRLPKLDTISFRASDPAELAKVIGFALWIDRDAFGYQTVQHSIQVIHLKIEHGFLRRRKVCIVWFEKGEDDLAAAADYFLRLGIVIRRVLTDNGPCFHADRFAEACADINIVRKYTRPYTPRTNGKAERFIQTAIREWAYARKYENSQQRLEALQPWTHQYNWHRPHASLDQKPPISRSGLDVNNLLRHHI